MSSYPKISIILLNWNGKKDTLECLASLKELTYPNFETIVVDNGSTDGSIEAIKTNFPKISLIETGENLGFAEGNNVGIIRALFKGADFIFLLNNDTIVHPAILEEFVKAAHAQPKGGIFGAKVYRYNDKERLDHVGGNWNPKKSDFDSIGIGILDDHKSFEKMQQVDYVSGCSLFFKSELAHKIGFLEPKFFLMWEESDFCARAKKAGYEIWSAPQAKIWHKVSSSFNGKAHLQYFWWRNRLLWIKRNCSFKEKCLLYKVILPEILHLYKILFLKRLQFTLSYLQKKETREKKHKILLFYKAGWSGIKDYFFKNFFNCPAIFRNKNK